MARRASSPIYRFFRIVARILGIILLCLAIFLSVPLFIVGSNHDIPLIEVRHGDSIHDLALRLKDDHVIMSVFLFRAMAKVRGSGRHLVAGEFKLPNYASINGILSLITDVRNVHERCITFPEGISSKRVRDILLQAPAMIGEVPHIPAGSVLPETYCYVAHMKRHDLLKKMTFDMTTLIQDLWANRDPALPYKTLEEAIVLASVVEAETGVARERALIASVFINRLRLGMRLQSDPTVAFGLGRDSAKGLTKSDLRSKTPYNTYVIPALPPHPINNPGREALRAVFYPETTNYLYFVASADGGHVFSITLDEHNKNVALWRKVEKVLFGL